MMRLFGKARSIHQDKSWKIPLSIHPTQSLCVFTQPPGNHAQASSDRQIQGGWRNKAVRILLIILAEENHS